MSSLREAYVHFLSQFLRLHTSGGWRARGGCGPRAELAGTGRAGGDDTYGQIRGYNDGPIKVFKGVPYGAPTGGANRWLPPKPPAHWSGVKDTTAPGGLTPQNIGAPMEEESVMLQTGPMNEDMLNLNVFTYLPRRWGRTPASVR